MSLFSKLFNRKTYLWICGCDSDGELEYIGIFRTEEEAVAACTGPMDWVLMVSPDDPDVFDLSFPCHPAVRVHA